MAVYSEWSRFWIASDIVFTSAVDERSRGVSRREPIFIRSVPTMQLDQVDQEIIEMYFCPRSPAAAPSPSFTGRWPIGIAASIRLRVEFDSDFP
jgi:hypothetical protein